MEHKHTPSSCGGQDDIAHWTAVMEWWGEAPQLAALETLCVLLRRVGPLLPPLSLVSPPSKHGWDPPGRTRNIYRGCGKGAGGQVEHLVVQEEGGALKTRGLTRHSKQPTKLCSPCCGQPSIRSSSPTSPAECSGWQSLTIKPTAHFKFRPGGTFNLSHISKYVDVAWEHLRKAPTIWKWTT